LLQRDLLPLGPAGRIFDRAPRQRLERHATAMELRLEDVGDGLQLHVVGGGDHDVGLVEGDLVLAALEVVARLGLPPDLIERVGDLLHVDLTYEVERVLGGHGSLVYRSGTVATQAGGTNVKSVSGKPEFTASRVKRMLTVFSNWS